MNPRRAWLGMAEGPRLEFKREDANDDALLRTIVAFLNTSGGELVIGVDAPGPQDVAIAEPGVREPHLLKERLANLVLDRVDPRPVTNLTETEVVRSESGVDLVVVRVKRSERKPHGLKTRAGVQFFAREGSSNRLLSVTEALQLAGAAAVDTEGFDARDLNARLADGVACARSGAGPSGTSLFCAFGTVKPPMLRETDWLEKRGTIRSLLEQERPFGMRYEGFNLALWPHWQPEDARDELRFGQRKPLFRCATVGRDATVWGAMRIDSNVGLSWASTLLPTAKATRGRDALAIRALVVVEFAVALARLAQRVMSETGAEGDAFARAVLFHGLPATVVGNGEMEPFNASMSGTFLEEPADTDLVRGTVGDFVGGGEASALVQDSLTRLFDCFGGAKSGIWRTWLHGDGFRFP
jgi:hypothetical protein